MTVKLPKVENLSMRWVNCIVLKLFQQIFMWAEKKSEEIFQQQRNMEG